MDQQKHSVYEISIRKYVVLVTNLKINKKNENNKYSPSNILVKISAVSAKALSLSVLR